MRQRYRASDFATLRAFDALYSPVCRHDLVRGVPVFPVGQAVSAAAQAYCLQGAFGYSAVDGEATFRQAALAYLAREGTLGRSVVATAGATGGMHLAMLALIESGDEVLVLDPDYAGYAHLALLLGATPVRCDLGEDFRLDVGAIGKRITARTKLIALSNPSNPLGLVIGPGPLQDLIALAARHGAWVLCDEVYADFAHGTGFTSAARLGENVVAVRSLSKSAGLAGWRIGYCVATEEVSARLCDVQEYSFICASVASQHVATALLHNPVDTSVFVERRRAVCDLLRNSAVRFVEPEAGFYVYIEAPPGGGMKFTRTCLDNDVAILPGALFSQRDTHVRISFAGEWPAAIAAVEAFTQVYRREQRES